MHVSRTQMREQIVMLLGGRVAEEIFLDDICTGASNDIERATKTARNMVTKYGFSEKLGTVVYGSDNEEVFLGKDYGHTRNYSESVAAQIDDEVKEIIEKAYKNCREILTANANKMHLLADYLLKYEKIDNDKFERLMRGENIEADEPAVSPAPVQDETETVENSENTEE
jgi:cell division protease FtsH